ncbi:hypothetical protein C6N75_15980 [Streptomyces solincola]|uniref:Helix-turn-helix domain-containing protein n=1 Tax=Streptomyces solincola TaxID=2100817 RepID=A0A2S9PUZ1_9ACTN|nr:hypothetical protein C6N75_15980 [Streptomyces solincola]
MAEQAGRPLKSYANTRPYARPGFPAPVSSAGARVQLWDGRQVDAYLAGRTVLPLPPAEEEREDDLLDRRECAALLGLSPRTWDTYKSDPALAGHLQVVGGVEHWPRAAVRQFAAARAVRPTAPAGRPKGVGDQVPREQLQERVAAILDADPTASAARLTEALGVSRPTAQDALTRLRAQRMADAMETDPDLTPQGAAHQLCYPGGQVRRAVVLAATIRRGRCSAAYLADVAAALHAAGWTTTPAAPEVQHPDVETCAAAIVLDTPAAPAPAVVWEERTGWRTAASRRHPLASAGSQQGAADAIRPLATGATPPPAAVVAALSTAG